MAAKKKVIIMGGGVAGLTAGLELLNTSDVYVPIIIEAEEQVGGIARTLNYKGNLMDIGGHRFFSKDEQIMKWWMNRMPLQGAPSKDDLLLNRETPLKEGGPDPEKENVVLLIRQRISRILYLRKFFDYPISLKPATFINMGFKKTVKAGISYLKARMVKRPENSLEDFMINRFGKVLYETFFEDYTEKLWGRHPSQIGADWGAQRIKGLSLGEAIKNALKSIGPKQMDLMQKNKETSLIEEFIYPKYGPGQLWQQVADEIEEKGGCIKLKTKVISVQLEGCEIKSIEVEDAEGRRETISGDVFLSSLPIKDLAEYIGKVHMPEMIYKLSKGLPYRDFMTVGLLVKKLNLENKTHLKTVGNIVPDTWIYIQERDVKLGRLQVFNNWSPYLVKDLEHTVWIGLEYFCDESDALWNMSDEAFIHFAEEELIKLGIINKEDIIDAVRKKIKKAYPAYFDTYARFDEIKAYLNSITNLYCIGRNGQHRYNNMDHSMATAFEAVHNILTNQKDKTNLWAVNTEKNYHETK